jgi:RNA polymerase sigma-70 factor (ECF subfamily)
MFSAPQVFDSRYVNALRQGDPIVEAHFVDHFSPILLRTLLWKVRSADRAKDLRQEVFLRVLAAVRSGDGILRPERFEAFVIGVCNNIVRESYRQQRQFVDLSIVKKEPMADFPSAYALVLAQEIRTKVRGILSELNGTEQTILEAILLDEQDKDETCRRLGISRGYLRVLLHRAKRQFFIRAQKDALQPQKSFRRVTHGRNHVSSAKTS